MEASVPQVLTTKQGKNKKDKKPNRTWIIPEELELIEGLKEAVIAGYKTKNGFKPGHLMFLQNHLMRKMPGTDLRANPHIESKMKVWRLHHGCIVTLLDRSGVGWNDEKKTIEASTEIWDQFALHYPSFCKNRTKSWPYYDDWCEIFGKDRATGNMTKDFQLAAAAKKILGENVMKRKDKETHHEEVGGNDQEFMFSSTLNEENSTSNYSKRSKSITKGGMQEMESSFSGAINKVVDFANTTFGVTTKIEESPLSVMRKNLVPLLKQHCKSLTLNQILKVGIKIANDVTLMELFYGLAEEDREAFAKINLEGTPEYTPYFNL